MHLSNKMYHLCALVPEMNAVEVRETLEWLKSEYKGAFNGGAKRLYGRLMKREEELMGIPNRRGRSGPVRVYYQEPSKPVRSAGSQWRQS